MDQVKKRRRLDLAAACRGREHGILPSERDQMQPATDQIGISNIVVLDDGCEPTMYYRLLILGVDEQRWPQLRARTEPISTERAGGAEIEHCRGLADGTLAGKQRGLSAR